MCVVGDSVHVLLRVIIFVRVAAKKAVRAFESGSAVVVIRRPIYDKSRQPFATGWKRGVRATVVVEGRGGPYS